MEYSSIIHTYRDALPPGELVQFPLAGIDRIGVPFWMLTFYPHNGPTNAGSGYGTSADEALTGAFGELTEVVYANLALKRMPRETGSYHTMLSRLGASRVVDPCVLCLDAGVDYSADRTLQWVAVERYRTGEQVYVPVEFVACQNSDVEPGDWLITLITNGLGAGLTRDQAIGHGLLELVQRDGNSVAFRALASDVAVELDDVRDPQTKEILRNLDAQGIDIIVKLASTDFGMPNLYVVGMDREARPDASPIMGLACGEAAHPDREKALRKALLEFAAARSRVGFSHGPLSFVRAVTPPGYLEQHMAGYNPAKDEQRALTVMRALNRLPFEELRGLLSERVLAVTSTIPFSSLPTVSGQATVADRDTLGRYVANQLADAGFDILVADFSPPEGNVHAVKVIVPGLEVETMSYHRIGERNTKRLMERDEQYIHIGQGGTGKRIHLTEEAEARLGGAAWLNTEAIDRTVGPLYALYREPARHAAAWLNERE